MSGLEAYFITAIVFFAIVHTVIFVVDFAVSLVKFIAK